MKQNRVKRGWQGGVRISAESGYTLDITDPQRQAALKRVKVGDSLTAIGTEAFAIALEPVA